MPVPGPGFSGFCALGWISIYLRVYKRGAFAQIDCYLVLPFLTITMRKKQKNKRENRKKKMFHPTLRYEFFFFFQPIKSQRSLNLKDLGKITVQRVNILLFDRSTFDFIVSFSLISRIAFFFLFSAFFFSFSFFFFLFFLFSFLFFLSFFLFISCFSFFHFFL